jgi:hypothetical protein
MVSRCSTTAACKRADAGIILAPCCGKATTSSHSALSDAGADHLHYISDVRQRGRSAVADYPIADGLTHRVAKPKPGSVINGYLLAEVARCR